MDVAIDSDVDDFELVTGVEVSADGEDVDVVYTEQADLGSLRDGLKESGAECNDSGLCFKPMAPVECEEAGKRAARDASTPPSLRLATLVAISNVIIISSRATHFARRSSQTSS